MCIFSVEGIWSPLFDGQGNVIGSTLRSAAKEANRANDGVFNYSISLLESGLLFTSLLDLVHYPQRDRGLRLFKFALMFFRSHSTHSKYAYEIVRFLMHQMCTLSLKSAHEEFYGLFANCQGTHGRNIPCDLLMEHYVKKIKWM